MKHIASVIMICLFANLAAAQNTYPELWKQVEKHESKGLPKSALKVVEQIEALAKKDDNTTQQIKTLLFKSKFALTLEEDAQLKVISDFKSAIATANTPTKNVLQNMLANLYWQYFQQNRWKFYNRTNTDTKVDDIDFRTWDLQTLFNEIDLQFTNSLQNGLVLQQTPLTDFDVIINTQANSREYRPSLFDLLSHNALSFYKTPENSITKPAYKFIIDDAKYLSDVDSFSKLQLTSKDSTSLELKALKVYQNLIKFHLKDDNKLALSDVNIQRLNFVTQNATFNDKNNVLLNTLLSERKTAKGNAAALYDFNIARLYYEQGSTHVANENDTHRWQLKKALELCNETIKIHPESRGAKQCEWLKQQILNSNFTITAESFIPINKDAKVLIDYKNETTLNFKIYKLTTKKLEKFNKIYQEDEKLDFFKTLDIVKSYTKNLKNENDYQSHKTEVLLPKLNNGRYLVVATSALNASSFAYATIQVTDLALVEKSQNNATIFQVINRLNGAPVTNAKVKVNYTIDYNRKNETKYFTTDNKGEFKILRHKNTYFNDLKTKVTTANDIAYFGEYYIYEKNELQPENTYPYYNCNLFIDRGIYRPGQTLYFKGIATETLKGKTSILPNVDIGITLVDANRQDVKTLELKTNEFGSINGEFILPKNSITGSYCLKIDYSKYRISGSTYFSVEEYKRPKFETKFNPITETYKVNDSVTVDGTALAYAGSNITDAKVVYRVKRIIQYPRWCFWRRPYVVSEPQEITFGETKTDASGNFKITFKAIPDESVDKSNQPTFQYEVTADVTDLNGETRSATTIVNVAYHALNIDLEVASNLDKLVKTNTIVINSKNLNNEFVATKGNIKIYKLIAPTTPLRPRPWNAPDYKTWNEEEFKTLFPYEAYNNEHQNTTWENGKLVFSESFNTETSKDIILKNIKKWESGAYKIIVEAKDKFNQDVKNEKIITVSSDTDKTVADNQLFTINTNKTQYNIGDTAEITFGSATKNLVVSVDIEKGGNIIDSQIVTLNNNKKTIKVPVTQNDLGGFVIHYSYAYKNSFNTSNVFISVPYPKTDLEIITKTFRDKLQPNTQETWSFTIKGPKGDKVSAELLASMYDASLEQFVSHAWDFNPLAKPLYYAQTHKNGGNTFNIINFRKHRERIRYNYFNQGYDSFNWFGLHLGNYEHYRRQYLRRLNSKPSSYKDNYKASISEGTIEGIVYDENGLPLPGVNIALSGTSDGTTTDFDGVFSLEAKKGKKLSVSFIGYKTLDIKISKSNFFNIILQPDTGSLDEVVVTAMGIKRERKSLAYEVAEVESSKMKVPINSRKIEEAEADKLYSFGNSGYINDSTINETSKPEIESLTNIQTRTNLKETAYFYPTLQTDKDGNVSFSFTTPEALTQWKVQLLAHTKNLETAVTTLETVTQKELMVIPNAPRFLRQGDEIVISSKIANISDKALSGMARLELTDVITGKHLHIIAGEKGKNYTLGHDLTDKKFTVNANGNTQVSWSLKVPDNLQAVQYKIVAKAGDFSDGEQNALPVLSNRMLVTETLPMWVKSNESRTFSLDKLASASVNNKNATLKHHKLTLEITSNPAWYAVQALPYLMEYPYDCNEQTFSRYYANALASHIANSNPKIKAVFDQWASTDALMSNLEKNEDLKSLLIQETPWLRDAQSETEQKKRIALLFDLNKMNNELQSALQKLKQNQTSSGAWAWFKGGNKNRFITQHIIAGFGHLKQLSVISTSDEDTMIKNAINYLDNAFIKEYNDLTKYNKNVDLSRDHLTYTQLHYLYTRSFFKDIKMSKKVKDIHSYYLGQIQKYWLKRSLYAKGLMALITYRNNDQKTAGKILKSLQENSITNDELGMYWKSNKASWYWHQAPIETQALMIEAFSEAGNTIQNETKNLETIDNLKIWLLKNKQVNKWETTKATSDAVYALLLQGSNWISTTEAVDVLVGNKKIDPTKLEHTTIEAGTGYFKTSWNGNEISPEQSKVTLTKKGNGIAWGALYWQYFEDLDKITSAKTPLKLKKKLFLKTNSDTGEQISEITPQTPLNIGDLVRVRIELRADRDMEFIHMKDMRAAGFEPVNVLSQYKRQDGLGYYESTKDAATNFFFDYLPKGVYVFEYDLRVNNAGDMSNGITTIQSMYAPEFSSHSEGVRVKVNN